MHTKFSKATKMTNHRNYQTLNESSFNINNESLNDGVSRAGDLENIAIVTSKRRVFSIFKFLFL